MLVEPFVSFCACHNIVSEDDIPTLRYCIEKRLYSLLIYMPLILLGSLISNHLTTVSFLWAFSYLRRMTNGFHAKTPFLCFLGSFILFLFVLAFAMKEYPLWVILILTSVSAMIIWILAPYNHPSMNYSTDEISACKKSAKIRLIITFSIMMVFYLTSESRIVNGIFFGIILVAALLGIAYIIDRRRQHAYFRKEN